jgi:hypothetical protein
MKTTKKEDNFPIFFFDSNSIFINIECPEDLQKIWDAYEGHMTKDEILDYAKNVPGSLTNFGMYGEHKGKTTLRKFLTRKNIKF